MDINKAMNICFKNSIKVYPEVKKGMLVVAVDNSREIKLGDKTHTTKTINKAIENTYVFLAEKLKG